MMHEALTAVAVLHRRLYGVLFAAGPNPNPDAEASVLPDSRACARVQTLPEPRAQASTHAGTSLACT